MTHQHHKSCTPIARHFFLFFFLITLFVFPSSLFVSPYSFLDSLYLFLFDATSAAMIKVVKIFSFNFINKNLIQITWMDRAMSLSGGIWKYFSLLNIEYYSYCVLDTLILFTPLRPSSDTYICMRSHFNIQTYTLKHRHIYGEYKNNCFFKNNPCHWRTIN